jgi:site-specific DNA-cytosine methylase
VGPALGNDNTCVFKDIKDIHGETAPCSSHKVGDKDKPCPVTSSRIHSSGFSCKELSKLNAQRVTKGRVALKAATGSSGITLQGLLGHAMNHTSEVLILENVDELMSAGSNNFSFLTSELAKRGYQCFSGEFLSNEYSLPTRRKRVYVIAFLVPHGKTADAVRSCAEKAVALAQRLKGAAKAPNIMDFLLKPDDEYLESEFVRRNEAKEQTSETEEKRDAEQWRETYRSQLEAKGLSVSQIVVPPAERRTRWYQLMSQRMHLVLGHSMATHPSLTSVDVYQSMSREFISCDKNTLSTLVPGSTVWLRYLKEPRMLLGLEALLTQGVPLSVARVAVMNKQVSDSNCMDLAGNAFSGTVFQACALAALVWTPLATDESSAIVVDAVTSILDL